MKDPFRILSVACCWLAVFPLSASAESALGTYTLDPIPLNEFPVDARITFDNGAVTNVLTDLAIVTASGTAATLIYYDAGLATSTGLQFVGGDIGFSNPSWFFDFGFLLGTITATGKDVRVTLNTPNPPGPISNEMFNVGDHEAIVYQGEISLLFDGLLFQFIPDQIIDFSTNALPVTFPTNQPITFVRTALESNTASYTSQITVPVDFNNDVIAIATDLVVGATITGVIQGTSTFVIDLPPPEIELIAPTGTEAFVVQSPAEPDVEYLVEQNDDLLSTNWVPVYTGTAVGIEFTYSETNTPLPDARAYRFTYP